MRPLTYRSFDPLTRAYLGRLPLETVSLQRRMSSEVGELRGLLPLAASAGFAAETPYATLLQAPDADLVAQGRLTSVLRAVRPGSLLVADAGGTPVWWGYVSANPYDSDTGGIQVLAKEPWNSAQRRLLRTDLNYGNNGVGLKDQTSEIFKGLLDWMLGETAWSNLGWDTSTIAASGVLRERHYVGAERHYVGELCQDLANLQNGFQFTVDCVYDTNHMPLLQVRTGYPRLGRRYDASNPGSIPRLSFPGTIIKYIWVEDELAYATEIDAISRNTDGSVSIATAFNQALRDQGFPEQSNAVNFDNVTDVTGTLQEHADAEAHKRSTPLGIPTITASADAVLGYITPGDDTLLYLQDWRFPVPQVLIVRVLGYDINLDQGTADLHLDLTA